LIFIDAESVFEIPNAKNWGFFEFVHHDKLYSANNKFVKNDVVFLCARIVRKGVLPRPPSDFCQNLWLSYKNELTGECILKVSGEEFKVILNVSNLF
jgi:hypothetical protein